MYRKIENIIESHLNSGDDRILLVDGARQTGKSYIIRKICSGMFNNYIELNMEEDRLGRGLFASVGSIDEFYFVLGSIAGRKLNVREDTLVFIDEIQAYPKLLTLLKFLREDRKYTFIASGSALGIALKRTVSIPIGSIRTVRLYPMDFEEFLIAQGVGQEAIGQMRLMFSNMEALPEALHNYISKLFRNYLMVGGLPAVVQSYVDHNNIALVRDMQKEILGLYRVDASRYEAQANRVLKIRRIYDMLPSNLENRKKRIVVRDIEGKDWKRYENYQEEFEYLVASGITLEINAISGPGYPLIASGKKNLLKLYLNDVGLLSGIYFGTNIQAVTDENAGVNLGAVYETVVAQELRAHGHPLFYYDNKKLGEVDFLIDDTETLSTVPIEVKSGKDYFRHRALDRFVSNHDYAVRKAFVVSNERSVYEENGITYLPIYYVSFF